MDEVSQVCDGGGNGGGVSQSVYVCWGEEGRPHKLEDLGKGRDLNVPCACVCLQRNDSSVFAWAFALFVGPALLILATAYLTGYLDSMYTTSLSAFQG